MQKQSNFIQDRLDSLYEIDSSITQLLGNFSSTFEAFASQDKQSVVDNVNLVYGKLSKIAIDLRKEVRTMDENIGSFSNNNENIMLLPINVDKKNTMLGRAKFQEELETLNDLIKCDVKYVEKENDNVKVEGENDVINAEKETGVKTDKRDDMKIEKNDEMINEDIIKDEVGNDDSNTNDDKDDEKIDVDMAD